jgi:hypothetical protein
MVRAFPHLILGILSYIHQNVPSLFQCSSCTTYSKAIAFCLKNYLDNNVYFAFQPFVFYIKDFNLKALLLSSKSKDGLYVFFKSSIMSIPQVYWSPCVSTSIDLWHCRLSHPTSLFLIFKYQKIKLLVSLNVFNFGVKLVY